jgi:hypothetical protein
VAFFPDGRVNRAHWFLAATAIALVASALDIAQWLRAIPLWVDEEMIAINLRDRQFSQLPGALWLAQSAPLAWLFAQRAVVMTLGSSEIMLRLIPLLFGIATLGVAVWIGRRWLHPISAAVLVVICALGQWLSHYRFEVKHYSADAFWGLLLPALAAWAIEEDESGAVQWRWTRWWAVAALAQWTANGAFLVVPGCAAFAFAVILRRHGIRSALRFAATGVLWLASLGVHYILSLQYAHHSRYLNDYWSAHVVPPSIGWIESLTWMSAQLERVASNPGGATIGLLLWAVAFAGFAFGNRPRLAGMFVTVPVVGIALAVVRLVPLGDRLALWIVPSLYLGVVLLFNRGVDLVAAGSRARRPLRLTAGAFGLACAAWVAGDVAAAGYRQLDLGLPTDTNHALDDKRAVRWLMERRQPGDALLSNRLAWPAIWWYGGISLADPYPGGRLPDRSVMFEVTHDRATPACGEQLRDALKAHRRVLLYVGFPDKADGFYQMVVRELAAIGSVVEESSFGPLSQAAVFQLDTERHAPAIDCVVAYPVRRW